MIEVEAHLVARAARTQGDDVDAAMATSMRTTGRSQSSRPSMVNTAGRPKSSNETIELTGFPGSPRCGTRRPSGARPRSRMSCPSFAMSRGVVTSPVGFPTSASAGALPR